MDMKDKFQMDLVSSNVDLTSYMKMAIVFVWLGIIGSEVNAEHVPKIHSQIQHKQLVSVRMVIKSMSQQTMYVFLALQTHSQMEIKTNVFVRMATTLIATGTASLIVESMKFIHRLIMDVFVLLDSLA